MTCGDLLASSPTTLLLMSNIWLGCNQALSDVKKQSPCEESPSEVDRQSAKLQAPLRVLEFFCLCDATLLLRCSRDRETQIKVTATRQRNGVYLTHEAYEELTNQSESYRILVKEQGEKIEVIDCLMFTDIKLPISIP
jgi:hypothetical protein